MPRHCRRSPPPAARRTTDNDTVPDGCDVCVGFDDTVDTDNDGVPNGCDVCMPGDDMTDTDNDGVPDACDICAGSDDSIDTDNDTVPDGCDICAGFDDMVDTDNDNVPDGCDICAGFDDNVDTDNDSVPNGCDICAGFDDNVDTDNDGVPNGCDICAGFDDNVDTDNDGVPNGCDLCEGFDDAIDDNMNNIPDGCEGCPQGGTDVLAGPNSLYGYCFYLGVGGATCDQVCSFGGGSNMAAAVENLWPDSCAAPAWSASDVSTWYFNNGNPGNWSGPTTGGLSYHTIGYGYSGAFGDTFYGKCSTGATAGSGTYPADSNNSASRQLVCACAVGQSQCEYFEAANGTTIPGWTENQGDFLIDTQRVYTDANSGVYANNVTLDGSMQDDGCATMSVEYGVGTNVRSNGIVLRWNSPNDYVVALIQDNSSSGNFNSMWIYEYPGSVQVASDNTPGNLGTNPIIDAAIVGTTITLRVDVDRNGTWDNTLSGTTSKTNPGLTGMMGLSFGSHAFMDDFCWGNCN